MSGDDLRQEARKLQVKQHGGHAQVRALILDGFFDQPVTSAEVCRRINEKFGVRWPTSKVQPYLLKFIEVGILHGIATDGIGKVWVLSSVPHDEVLRIMSKGRKVAELEHDLFSAGLTSKLSKNFQKELAELHDNFGRNGDCTAFLLRKILEKLLIIVFGKLGKSSSIEDMNRPGGWKGLKDIVELAAKEKIHGIPILLPKTANELKGIKFLGDTAAHNPLVNVDPTTILPQLPFVITAYEELAMQL